MYLSHSLSDFKTYRSKIDLLPNFSIGFIPTMGALHEGHTSLIRQAKEENDLVIVSVFVNPTQFDKEEDLEKYPRNLEKDADLLQDLGVDVLFSPNKDEMYEKDFFLRFNFGDLESGLEGAFRDSHFNGVATIVSKLFNIVRPHKAYFGQKDLQQVAIIKDLVNALNFNLEIVRCPIVRDSHGLALSSRNERLSEDEKKQALILSKTIDLVRNSILNGEKVKEAIKNAKNLFKQTIGENPEYLEVVLADSLVPYNNESTEQELAVCIASPLGPVRLIDNCVFFLK